MANPQQPELARSRKTPHQDQDAVAVAVEGQRALETDAPRGPVPPENQPGHHPAEEQDKPDLDAFAERLGIAEEPADAAASAGSSPPAQGEPADAGAAATVASATRRSRTAAIVAAVAALVVVAIRRRRRRAR